MNERINKYKNREFATFDRYMLINAEILRHFATDVPSRESVLFVCYRSSNHCSGGVKKNITNVGDILFITS